LPEGLRRFVRRAGRRDPQIHYQDMSQALEDLRPLLKLPAKNLKKRRIEARRQTAIRVSYDPEQQSELRQLMREFSVKAEKLGISLKIDEAH